MRIRLTLSTILLFCASVVLLAGGQDEAETETSGVVLEIAAPGLAPSRFQQRSAANPNPRSNSIALAEAWSAANSDQAVRIEWIQIPSSQIASWVRTQFAGGSAPPIVSTYVNSVMIRDGYLANLYDVLMVPNNYNPDAGRWYDTFISPPSIVYPGNSDEPHIFYVPDSLVATTIYYNRQQFEAARVEPPETWSELLEISRDLRAEGFEPFGVNDFSFGEWTNRLIGDQLLWSLIPEMNVLNRNPDEEKSIDQEEFVRAITLGIYSTERPEIREGYRVLKEWSEAWVDGWIAADIDIGFRRERMAMSWFGSWIMGSLEQDPLMEFDLGTFWFPPMTTETSLNAIGRPPRDVGGIAPPYLVSATSQEEGMFEVAVDFLRFLTTPENNEFIINEIGGSLVNVRGAEPHPRLEEIFSVYEEVGSMADSPMVPLWPEIAGQLTDNITREVQLYLIDELEFEELMQRVQRHLENEAEIAIRENPSWNRSEW